MNTEKSRSMIWCADMAVEVARHLDDLSDNAPVCRPFFLATKLKALAGRGRGDYLASHDMEE